MLLPRNREDGAEGEEEDPRAELLRRLQEYERFKNAAENLDELPRLERDIFVADIDAPDRIQERASGSGHERTDAGLCRRLASRRTL